MPKKKKKRKKKKKDHTSPSSLGMFLCCRRKGFYHSVRRLTLKSPRLSLEIGKIWHTCMETFYTAGKVTKAQKAITTAINKSVSDGFSAMSSPASIAMNRAMLLGMFAGYVDKYKKKDLREWKFLEREHHFTLPNIFGSGIDFTGIIDGVVEIKTGKNKGIWVLEHKTTKDLSYYTVESIKKSIQTLGYIYAVRKLFDIKPKGIIWNAVRKPSKRLKKNQTVEEYCTEIREDYIARPAFYFLREQLRINKSAIDEWIAEATHQLADLELCYDNKDTKEIWYKNTNLCDMYGGCEFTPLCFRGEKRSTLMLFRNIQHE